MQIARATFAAVSRLFIALVVIQVFLAGLGLFGSTDMRLHRNVGYWIPFVPLVMLVAALVARAGARTSWLVGGLLLISFVQTTLPLLREDLPVIAALHPVTALLMFWLGLVVARRATALYRAPAEVTEASSDASAADTASA